VSALWDNGYRLARWTLLPKWRNKAAQRGVILRAVLDFWRGRFGKVNVT
jgi:hypothetical protein